MLLFADGIAEVQDVYQFFNEVDEHCDHVSLRERTKLVPTPVHSPYGKFRTSGYRAAGYGEGRPPCTVRQGGTAFADSVN